MNFIFIIDCHKSNYDTENIFFYCSSSSDFLTVKWRDGLVRNVSEFSNLDIESFKSLAEQNENVKMWTFRKLETFLLLLYNSVKKPK